MKSVNEDTYNKVGHPVGTDVDPTNERPPKNAYTIKKKPAQYKPPVKEAADPGQNKVVNKKVTTTAKEEKKKTKQASAAQKVLDIVKGKKHKIDVEPTVSPEHVKVQ
jgi:hypothetical protein